jgi:hypothetical protein
MCGKLADSGTYSLTYVLPLWFLRMAKRYTRTMKLSPAARNRLSQIHACETLPGMPPWSPRCLVCHEKPFTNGTHDTYIVTVTLNLLKIKTVSSS